MHNRLTEAPGFQLIESTPRERLRAYREEPGHSNATIADEIGLSAALVSQYIGGKYPGDNEAIDLKVENIFRNASLRKIVATEIFDTSVTDAIAGAISIILKTNDFACINGPAGIGKTCGAAQYVANNPTSIFVTLWQDCCNAHYLQKQIFAYVKSRAFAASRKNRTEWIFDRLQGSNRLVIIDNGHKLTKAARKWIFDFHDATGCPVVLLANPEIIDAIKLNDQQFSRIGMCPRVELDPEEIPGLARRILQRTCPQYAKALENYAITVATNRGHLRNLVKELRFTMEFIELGESDPKAAFRAAHSQLSRDYLLK